MGVVGVQSCTQVDVAPLRAAFDRECQRRKLGRNALATEVAAELGWTRGAGRTGAPDGTRVLRVVGLAPYLPGRGYPLRTREHVRYETAVAIVKALDLDPVEVGV